VCLCSHFWARPILCNWTAVLSVTLVYCDQTIESIKMKLGMEVGLGHGHIVLDAKPAAPSPKGAQSPIFGLCCGQMPGWIKMPLGKEVVLGPGDIVLDGDPAPLQKRGHSSPHCIAGNHSLSDLTQVTAGLSPCLSTQLNEHLCTQYTSVGGVKHKRAQCPHLSSQYGISIL